MHIHEDFFWEVFSCLCLCICLCVCLCLYGSDKQRVKVQMREGCCFCRWHQDESLLHNSPPISAHIPQPSRSRIFKDDSKMQNNHWPHNHITKCPWSQNPICTKLSNSRGLRRHQLWKCLIDLSQLTSSVEEIGSLIYFRLCSNMHFNLQIKPRAQAVVTVAMALTSH